MSNLEDLLSRQNQISVGINTLYQNFKKDGPDRKTTDYIKRRVDTLDTYWKEYQSNHQQLMQSQDQSDEYFVSNHYQQLKDFYSQTREKILLSPTTSSMLRPGTPLGGQTTTPNSSDKGVNSKMDDLIKKQLSNFKAFARTASNINVENIKEKCPYPRV